VRLIGVNLFLPFVWAAKPACPGTVGAAENSPRFNCGLFSFVAPRW
jgi:hypothetical protein